MSDTRRETVRFRGGGFVTGSRRWAPWLAFALILAAWEAASLTGLLPALFMPAPHEVVLALHALLVDGQLFVHIGASLQRIVIGRSEEHTSDSSHVKIS